MRFFKRNRREEATQQPDNDDYCKRLKHILKEEKLVRKQCGKRALFGYLSVRVAKTVTRRYYLKVILIQLIFQIVFQIVMVVYCFNLESTSAFFVNRLWYNALIETEFEGSLEQDITFTDVGDIKEIWGFIKEVFLPTVSKTKHKGGAEPSSDQFYQTNMLGTVRIRQLRVKSGTCSIWKPIKDVPHLNLEECYGQYVSKSNENTEALVKDQQQTFEYHSESVLTHVKVSTELVKYSGGGYIYDLPQPIETVQIEKLETSRWIDEATRVVFLHGLFYCGSINKFTQIRLIFELPAAGGVLKHVQIRVQDLVYGWGDTIFLFVNELLISAFVILIITGIVVECVYFKWKVFTSVWLYVDGCIVVLNVLQLFFDIKRYSSLPWFYRTIKKEDTYVNIEQLMACILKRDLVLSVEIFFAFVRIYKYFCFSKNMAKLNNTIGNASGDIVTFTFVFLLSIVAFANLALLLFGDKVKQFSTIQLSVYSLLKLLFGTLEYDDLEDTQALLRVFFFIYVVVAVIVLLNTLLGIISDAYNDREESDKAITMWEYIKESYTCCYCCRKKLHLNNNKNYSERNNKGNDDEGDLNDPHEDIKAALIELGFTELEIELFFGRYNIQKGAIVYDYDRETLKEKLEEIRNADLSDIFRENLDKKLDYKAWQREEKTLKNLEDSLKKANVLVDQLIKETEAHVALFKKQRAVS